MRLVLLSAAAVVLVVLLTVVVVLRRGGRTGEDLLASQLRSVDQRPGSDRPASSDPAESIDDATWRRIEELVMAGRRVQAIELVRTVAGCRLAEAKAVVDRPADGA